MDERLKFFLLLNYVNANKSSAAKFFAKSDDVRELWRPTRTDVAADVVSEKSLAALRKANDTAWAENELERAEKMGISVMTIDDDNYPDDLANLKDAPLILYWKGKAEKFPDTLKVSVVGTRRMSAYGRDVSRMMGRMCGENDIALISGGAWGVDGTSQNECCDAGGATFAILGTGVDIVYPAANRTLFEKISSCGALVSEFPIGSKGLPWRFPQRNRIVAALAQKTIVVEAPMKSGSMITARLALELGKEVWAVPGQIFNSNSQGTNRLIYDGAYPFVDEETFLASCGISQKKKPSEDIPENLTDDERNIINALHENGTMPVDSIAAAVGMTCADILKYITMLSAKGYVYMSAAGRYSLKKNL
ncbi:MAG: DNA-processing protein DprA [Synergistes sp.]|nr:DNA-processing protein DprA [Synergistes sp.]